MADTWVTAGPDPRDGEQPVGEKATYADYLRIYRHTLALKCEGLSPEQLATRSVPPSTMSLLGLVRHLASVEQFWFAQVGLGLAEPQPFRDAEVPDLDFVGAEPTDACVTEAFERWRAEIGRAEAWLAGVPESELGRELVIRRRDGELVTIRDLLVHMIEEYARHCGHADLLREAIDGRTGQ